MTSALASSGACSVIHCAGFGLSGTSNLPAFNGLTRKVNVTGTEVVMEACLRNNVTNLGQSFILFH
jgi:nucleoside-diphosphate-sugar epimerase